MVSPTPPPTPSASQPAIRVTSVMAGEQWTDPNGNIQLAGDDIVLLEFLDPACGHPTAVLAQSPDTAISLAHMIQLAAVKLINAEVNDEGKHLSLAQRVVRINAAAARARA